jgi:hypothetical protein
LTGSQWTERVAREGCMARVDRWWTKWRQTALGGVDQRGVVAGQALLGVEEFDQGAKLEC